MINCLNLQKKNPNRLTRMLKITHILSFLMAVAVIAGAQEPVDTTSGFGRLVGLIRKVKTFQSTYPLEKVYMHFDNTGYFQGEKMFFKAYVNRMDSGKPTDISRVLYVDLLNPSGDVMHRSKLRIEEGEATGSIRLDTLFSTGFYEVRAYTNYMLNFGEETAFSRVFPIFRKPEKEGDYGNPVIDYLSYFQKVPEREIQKDFDAQLEARGGRERRGRGYTVNVYPEGGKLVKGVLCRVAFSVTDLNNEPAELAGEVVDADGNTLTIVSSDKDGKGLFEFVPTSSKLSMILTTSKLQKLEFDMPEVLEEGVVMRVDAVSDDSRVSAVLQATEGMRGQLMGMSLSNNGNLYKTDTLTLKEINDIRLPRRKIQPGVNQLTLFDTDGHIHAERLFFICPEPTEHSLITVESLTDKIVPCGTVRLKLHSAPKARYSVSVMDAWSLTNGKYGNINTYMLLGSDVRGYIPNPEYYFEADDQEHREAADRLMLFNGWRRYDWTVMTGGTPWRNKKFQIEDDQYIYGCLKPSISKWKKNNPVEGVNLDLYIYGRDDTTIHGSTVTDSTGFYAFHLPDSVYGDWNMQIQTRLDKKRKNYEVTINRNHHLRPRYITSEETRMIDFPSEYLRFEPDYEKFDQLLSLNDTSLIQQTGKNEYVMASATIKARRKEPSSLANWFDEHNAIRHASLYYDCQTLSEQVSDQGVPQPTFYDWLADNNKLYSGTVIVDEETGTISGKATYGGRDVMWIVNNHWVGTTGRSERVFNDQIIDVMGTLSLSEYPGTIPVMLDEVKSAYVWSNQVSPTQNVVIYLYTYPEFNVKIKGCRNTYYKGYDVPTKFKMDNYKVMSPQPNDFRRTIYWNPSVTANSVGDATLEFFNNSTCSEMYISAEGITEEGQFMSTK